MYIDNGYQLIVYVVDIGYQLYISSDENGYQLDIYVVDNNFQLRGSYLLIIYTS